MAEPRPASTPSREVPAPFAQTEPFYARSSGGFELREVLDILLRGKWMIFWTTVLVVIPVAIASFLSPSLYRSYSLLLVETQDQDLADVLPDSPSSAFFRSERNLGNEILVLRQSLPLALEVAEQLVEIGTVPGTDRPLSILAPPADGSELTPLIVAFRLQAMYVESRMEGSEADAIRVSAASEIPAEAALITNLYSQSFVDLTQSDARAGVTASREFLEDQVSQQGNILEERDSALRDYMMRDGAVALEEEAAELVERVASLDARRGEARVDLQTRRAQIRALQSQLARLEPQLAERLASGLDQELITARERVAELEAQLEPFYEENPALRTGDEVPPRVAQLQRELERAEARVQDVSERLAEQSLASGSGPGDQQSGFIRAQQIRTEIDQARVAVMGLEAQIAQLSSSIAQYERQLEAIPTQSIEVAQLQRERRAAESLYGALEQNLQQARVAEESQLGYAQVIRPAFPAGRPFSPRRAQNILIGLFLGFMLGCVLAIAKVRMDHKLYTPDEVRDLGVPLIGTIPTMADIIDDEYDGADVVEVGDRAIDSHLLTILNPMASASEAYRALRTSIQFSRPDAVVQTILVTSANPAEGKSTTAANLGVVMAQAGRRVLLVDCDLRKPTVHRKFGISREPGLVQHIFSDAPLQTADLYEVADDMYVLPAGSIVPNPSELIGSRRMREVVDNFREQFDIIIFDAPPVLAATDAVLLSTQCDATVVVARGGQTRDYELQSALETLRDVGTQAIGVVLNGFDVGSAYGYAYKYAYRYSNRYAYGSEK